MIFKNSINLLISIHIMLLLIAIGVWQCNKNKEKTRAATLDLNYSKKEQLYKDSLEFTRGQLTLKENQIEEKDFYIIHLEGSIDSLTSKHNKTKQKIKPFEIYNYNSEDTGFVLAPNEYVDECEDCFSTMNAYKDANQQLRFERDGYDSLMRMQSRIQEARISNLQDERLALLKSFSTIEENRIQDSIKNSPTRKLKISAIGQLNNMFMPRGGGGGLIYEDKKYNEYGAHVMFTNQGRVYLLHIAKTISFKRKSKTNGRTN